MSSLFRAARPATAAALLAVAALGALAAGADAAPVPRDCAKLTGRTVVRTATVRIVSRPLHEVPKNIAPDTTLSRFDGLGHYSCTLPHGRVHLAGRSGRVSLTSRDEPLGEGIEENSTRFRQITGRFALRTQTYSGHTTVSDYSGSSTDLVDLRSGRKIARLTDDDKPTAKVLLDRQGHVAMILDEPFDEDVLDEFGDSIDHEMDYATYAAGPTRSVVVISTTGAVSTLDRAPRSELTVPGLRLEGTTVSWTHGDAPRSARIPGKATPFGPAVPVVERCDQALPGTPVRSSDGARILSRPIDRIDPPKNLRFTGTAYFACALPNGVLRQFDRAGNETNGSGERVQGTTTIDIMETNGPFFTWRRSLDQSTYRRIEEFGLQASSTAAATALHRDERFAQTGGAPFGFPVASLVSRLTTNGRVVVLRDDPQAKASVRRTLAAQRIGLGDVQTLDRAPVAAIAPESVAVDGLTVTWSRAGTPRTATLK
ncbi:MAG: hypothetical protein JWP18_262 [Solirubrobacterales bacterium]|nr:hypothetical protein [Solirubrobacterales bacterium]